MLVANRLPAAHGFVLCHVVPATPRDQLPKNPISLSIHPPLLPAEPASTPSFTYCTVIPGASICLKWFTDEEGGLGAESVCDRVTYCIISISMQKMSKSVLWNQSDFWAWIFLSKPKINRAECFPKTSPFSLDVCFMMAFEIPWGVSLIMRPQTYTSHDVVHPL